MDRDTYGIYLELKSVNESLAKDFLNKTVEFEIQQFLLDDIKDILNVDEDLEVLDAVKKLAEEPKPQPKVEVSVPKERPKTENNRFEYTVKEPYKSNKIRYKEGKKRKQKRNIEVGDRQELIAELEDLDIEYDTKDSTYRLQRKLDIFKSKRSKKRIPKKEKIIDEFVKHNKENKEAEEPSKGPSQKNIIKGWN